MPNANKDGAKEGEQSSGESEMVDASSLRSPESPWGGFVSQW